jgi:Ser/Thr protein kinase RdoA (MazF antagonist)
LRANQVLAAILAITLERWLSLVITCDTAAIPPLAEAEAEAEAEAVLAQDNRDHEVAGARQFGYPTPAWLAAGLATRGFVYQVQEFVPGRPAESLTESLARQLVDVLESSAAGHRPDRGGDPRSDWSQFVLREMSGGPDGLPLRVAKLGSLEAAAVERAVALSEWLGSVSLPADDLVHDDLNLGNVLVDADGMPMGVVDIEALGAGSRAIDYAALWHNSADDGDVMGLNLVRGRGTCGGPERVRHVRAVERSGVHRVRRRP